MRESFKREGSLSEKRRRGAPSSSGVAEKHGDLRETSDVSPSAEARRRSAHVLRPRGARASCGGSPRWWPRWRRRLQRAAVDERARRRRRQRRRRRRVGVRGERGGRPERHRARCAVRAAARRFGAATARSSSAGSPSACNMRQRGGKKKSIPAAADPVLVPTTRRQLLPCLLSAGWTPPRISARRDRAGRDGAQATLTSGLVTGSCTVWAITAAVHWRGLRHHLLYRQPRVRTCAARSPPAWRCWGRPASSARFSLIMRARARRPLGGRKRRI